MLKKIVSAFLIWSLALSWLPPADARVRGSAPNTPAQNLGGLVGNIAGPSYFSNMRPFVNWAVQANNGNGNRALNSNTVTELAGWVAGNFNSNGDLNSGAAITGVTNLQVTLFTAPTVSSGSAGIGTLPAGAFSATFQGTVATNILTVPSSPSGTILPGDQIIGVGLQGTKYNVQPYGTGGTTGTGGAGTYQLSNSATVSVAVAMTSYTYWWTGQQLTVQWAGSSVTSVTAAPGSVVGTGGSFPTCTASPCTLTMGYNITNFALIFNFPSGAASPPTQIQIFQPKFAAQMAACVAGTLISCWNPEFVAAVGPIGIKRYMDMESTNSNGLTDISQYADQNYTHLGSSCGGINSFDGQISGTTLTATGSGGTTGASMSPGMLVQDTTGQIAANTILQSGTGGGNGTYTVNNSQTIANVTGTGATSGASTTLNVTGASGTVFVNASITGTNIPSNGGPTIVTAAVNLGGGAWTVTMSRASTATVSGTVTFIDRMYAKAAIGWVGTGGTKCGVHPSLLVALANATNTGIQFNMPPTMSDAGATAIYTVFNNTLKNGLTTSHELCNENWNGSLGQCFTYLQALGRPIFNSGTGSNQMAGYLAAHFLSLAQAVYGPGNRANWRGIVGGQLVNDASVPTAFLAGVNTWIAANSPGTAPTDLFDDVVIAPYVSDFSTWSTVINSMIADSTACYVSAAASLGSGSSITGNVLTPGTVTGTIAVGQGLSGQAGIPAHTYINSGTGPYTLNNSVSGTVTGTMATTPCATNYQFFSQQLSKTLITGTNDYSYALSGNVAAFAASMQPNQLFANSNGFQLRNYEGGFQLQPTVTSPQQDFLVNYFFDPAGNDPLYTPALVMKGINQAMQAVQSPFTAHFEVYNQIGTYNPWNYPGDTNPMWTELLAENAAGPFVPPPPVSTPTVSYTATDHNFASGSGTTLTCPLTSTGAGLAVVTASQTSGTIPSSVTIDSVAVTTADAADTASAWRPSIWSKAVTAGAHTVTVTWGTAQSFRSCAAMLVSGLQNNAVASAATGSQHSVNLPVSNGAFIIAAASALSAPAFQASSTPSGRISGCPSTCSNVNQVDLHTAQSFAFAYWSPGPPFTTPIFNIQQPSGNGMTAASYN